MKTSPTAPPYHLVLIPRFDLSPKASEKSILLAQSLSKVRSETNRFQVVDFDEEFIQFTGQPLCPSELKNLLRFIEVSHGKFFVQGTITFVANFDGQNLGLMIESFKLHKPDVQILLLMTQIQYVTHGIFEELECVDLFIHQGSVSKDMMVKLGMLSESH